MGKKKKFFSPGRKKKRPDPVQDQVEALKEAARLELIEKLVDHNVAILKSVSDQEHVVYWIHPVYGFIWMSSATNSGSSLIPLAEAAGIGRPRTWGARPMFLRMEFNGIHRKARPKDMIGVVEILDDETAKEISAYCRSADITFYRYTPPPESSSSDSEAAFSIEESQRDKFTRETVEKLRQLYPHRGAHTHEFFWYWDAELRLVRLCHDAIDYIACTSGLPDGFPHGTICSTPQGIRVEGTTRTTPIAQALQNLIGPRHLVFDSEQLGSEERIPPLQGSDTTTLDSEPSGALVADSDPESISTQDPHSPTPGHIAGLDPTTRVEHDAGHGYYHVTTGYEADHYRSSAYFIPEEHAAEDHEQPAFLIVDLAPGSSDWPEEPTDGQPSEPDEMGLAAIAAKNREAINNLTHTGNATPWAIHNGILYLGTEHGFVEDVQTFAILDPDSGMLRFDQVPDDLRSVLEWNMKNQLDDIRYGYIDA